jgi:hypothetical protein
MNTHEHKLEYSQAENYTIVWVCACGYEESRFIECL